MEGGKKVGSFLGIVLGVLAAIFLVAKKIKFLLVCLSLIVILFLIGVF